VPLALLGIIIVIATSRYRLYATICALTFMLTLNWFASLHAYKQLNIYYPFSYMSKLTAIYRASDARGISIHLTTKQNTRPVYTFYSPNTNPGLWAPFIENRTPYRRAGAHNIHIDLRKGTVDWERELVKAKQLKRPFSVWQDWLENTGGAMAGLHWPERFKKNWWDSLNIASQWYVLPLLPLLLIGLVKYRHRPKEYLFPVYTCLIVGILTLQTTGVAEGRYRKPMEPYLIASLVVVAYKRRQLRLPSH
jgi:hypothetical protein